MTSYDTCTRPASSAGIPKIKQQHFVIVSKNVLHKNIQCNTQSKITLHVHIP